MVADRTGVLIIRAWIEEGSSEPLRAQLRLSTDVSAGFERTLTLAKSEAVCAAVQEWLAEFVRDASRPTDPPVVSPSAQAVTSRESPAERST